MHITINNPTFNFHAGPPALASALVVALLRGDEQDEPDANAPVAAQAAAGRPAIGEYWEGQGGIFAGDFRSGDGPIYGLIVAPEQDIGRADWGPNGSRNALTNWDGLTNTRALIDTCPAAKLAAGYTRDGHSDFYLPAHRELLLGAANLHETFGTESWYWTSTPYADSCALAFDFEYGYCNNSNRAFGFRVRPFRRFIY